MRIAMLHVDLPPATKGGVAHQVHRLSNALVDRGHEVVVHTLSAAPTGARYEVEQLRIGRVTGRSKVARMIAVPVAFATTQLDGFDVVHAHGDSHLMRRTGAPVLRTFYGSAREEAVHAERLRRRIAQRLLHRAEARARDRADVTVGISKSTERSVGRLDHIIPCGVDTVLFRPGEKSNDPSILFVGTLGGRKRGRRLVEWFEREVRAAVPTAELWLVADEEISGPGIRSHPWLDDDALADLYRRAWCFALPSTYEGFGVPYIEAMASGTPVVTSPNDGAREVVEVTGGGVLAEDAVFGETLVALLLDDDRRRDVARLARTASERYAWSEVAASYERAYAATMEHALTRTGR